MFAGVGIRVAHVEHSEAFYGLLLGTLGFARSAADEGASRWSEFCVAAADAEHPPTSGLHAGFVAESPRAVDAFWEAGRAAGYEDAGAPGPRTQYKDSYYGAFLRDPDGNSVEAVHHDDMSRGVVVDHLWIGVGDLERAARFYEAVARYAGLEPGASWETGRQFRGAWATMALVADGRPPTRGLQLAFPASQRRVVAEFHMAALAAGGRDAGMLGVLDPDGTRVESVVRAG